LIDLVESFHIERELMMVKVRTTGEMRDEIRSLANIFRARLLMLRRTTYIVEMTGTSEKPMPLLPL